MLIIKDGKKEGSKDKTHTHTISLSLSLSLSLTHTHTHTAEMLNAPLSRDGISDICGHMIREDFYYKITAQHPPPPLSVTYRGLQHHNMHTGGTQLYYTLPSP